MEPQPDTIAIVQHANDLLGQNEPVQAEALALEALRSSPKYLPALNTLAYACHLQAKHLESERAYLLIAECEPNEAMHWMNVGTAQRCGGRIDEALYSFARAAALGAATHDFYYNVALAHIAREDYESAFSLLKMALDLSPQDAETRYRFAFCCYETQRTQEALDALDGWESAAIDAPAVAADAAQLLMKLGEIQRAEPAVRSAARSDTDPRAKLTLIQMLERTNRLPEARALLDELQTDPRASSISSDLNLTRALIAQREGDHVLAIELFKRELDACKQPHEAHFHQYPLAKSLDSACRYEEAFAVLTAAHASQLAHLRLTAPVAVLRGGPALVITEHSCDATDVARWTDANAPSMAQSPIFIVGFPRSGTTLLEVALDAHPRLRSMDEQPFLQNALEYVLRQGAAYPHHMADLTETQLAQIRAEYWDRANRRQTVLPGQRLIDKNPLNILRLPVIKRLFPNAKILLAVRHPCDVLLSCFIQHFRAPDFALLCLDLPTLAKSYRRIFDFWSSQQALLSADVLELRYETFVDDFSTGIRRVIDFLEIPWNDAVLDPAQHAREKRFISTPSYSQVVEPVSRKAVGRWHHYRSHFAPSLPLLQPYLARWNYLV